jgi:hypothetical protein
MPTKPQPRACFACPSSPDEDWCFDVLPELNNLEADTLDALLAQAQQHAKYAPLLLRPPSP